MWVPVTELITIASAWQQPHVTARYPRPEVAPHDAGRPPLIEHSLKPLKILPL